MTRRRIERALEAIGARHIGNNEFTRDGKVVFVLFNRTVVMTVLRTDGSYRLLLMVAMKDVIDFAMYRGSLMVIHR